MGLIQAAIGAVSSTLADQYKEFFYCDALPNNVIVSRGHKKVDGRVSNKGNDNVISNGSVIAVADGQCIIIVEQGHVVDICAVPGEYRFDTSSEPSIFSGDLGQSIIETFKTIGRRISFGGSSGKDQRVYYFNIKDNQIVDLIEVEKNIKEGFSNNNFYMVYQPQYKMEGKRLRGFEALLRLKNNGGETISPAEFIPIAEASDLIFQIDDFVLNIVMQEFSPLLKKSKDIVISVNVSAKNIASFDFAERIERMLKKNDFNPHNLEIEITEYCLVNSVETTVQNINRLKDLGVQIALDDFGTGYTSLSYIAKLPVNLLKIDKTLVDDITSSQKSQDFVNAVISMGHIMGCDVISEGVENQPQLDILKTQGCDFVQGFVWSKPLDYDVAKDMIQKVS